MHGKITKLNAWTSGKGAFIQIDGKTPDYVFYGKPIAKIGDSVEFEDGKPTKDGKPVMQRLVVKLLCGPIEAFVDEDKPRSAPIDYRAHDFQAQGDAVKRAENVRLECLACACDVYSGAQETTTISTAERILALAEKFEKFAKGEKA